VTPSVTSVDAVGTSPGSAEAEGVAAEWVVEEEDPVELATTAERVDTSRKNAQKPTTSPATGVEEAAILPETVQRAVRTPENATTVATVDISPRTVLSLVRVLTGVVVTDVGSETTLPANALLVTGPVVTTASTWATLPRIAPSQLEPKHASLLLTLNCGLLGGSLLLQCASKPR